MTTSRFPYEGYAAGWYQLAWSHELGSSEVKSLHYFGEELVLWRDESGTAHVFDAFCPHLGAHLGHGGTVLGDELQCPFHGWCWDGDGCNTRVPNGNRARTPKRVNSWPVVEQDGFIFMWYHPGRAAPAWEPPRIPEATDGSCYDLEAGCIRCYSGVRANPMMILEGSVDVAHQKYVHGAADVSEIVEYGPQGAVFRACHQLVFGKAKSATWLTPDGEREGQLQVEVWGLGLGLARFPFDGALHVAAPIPIDEETSDMRITLFVQRGDGAARPGGPALKRLEYQWKQAENDLAIWENMRYEPRAPFTSDEAGPYRSFRTWAASLFARTDETVIVPDGEDRASVGAAKEGAGRTQ